ncbi:hypothetical protein XENTR_v10019304 [Xenopus tropicalis]|nr:hypothetical protein XENTR_v10019304 [Xenopus tropicalis]
MLQVQCCLGSDSLDAAGGSNYCCSCSWGAPLLVAPGSRVDLCLQLGCSASCCPRFPGGSMPAAGVLRFLLPQVPGWIYACSWGAPLLVAPGSWVDLCLQLGCSASCCPRLLDGCLGAVSGLSGSDCCCAFLG